MMPNNALKIFDIPPAKEIDYRGLKKVEYNPTVEKDRETKKLLRAIKSEEIMRRNGRRIILPPAHNLEEFKQFRVKKQVTDIRNGIPARV